MYRRSSRLVTNNASMQPSSLSRVGPKKVIRSRCRAVLIFTCSPARLSGGPVQDPCSQLRNNTVETRDCSSVTQPLAADSCNLQGLRGRKKRAQSKATCTNLVPGYEFLVDFTPGHVVELGIWFDVCHIGETIGQRK